MTKLKAIRMAMGLTQGEAARRAHLSPGWYNLIESGKLQASPRAREKLTRVFGMPAEDLLAKLSVDDLRQTTAQ